MTLSLEIGANLRLVILAAAVVVLIVHWWSYRAGGRR
jgi:hypothetical protein